MGITDIVKKSLIKNGLRSEFASNVLTVMSGTMIAQAISLAMAPALSRIYSPAQFGDFALYTSIVSILSTVVIGKYDFAVLLPKKDSDAFHLLFLSVIIACVVSSSAFFIVFLLNSKIAMFLNNPGITPLLFLIPLSLFVTGNNQILSSWLNRRKQFRTLVSNRVIQAVLISMLSLAFGLLNLRDRGLVFAVLVGSGVAMVLLWVGVYRDHIDSIMTLSAAKIRDQAVRYSRFPRYLILSGFLETFSGNLPVLFMTKYLGSTIVGYYALSVRVAGMPMVLIAGAVSEVFRQRASEDYNACGNCRPIFLKTFKRLFLIAVVPFLILFFSAPGLFAVVFGKNWRVAGEYTQIMSLMFFFQFCVSPLSYMFYIAEKQKYDLIMQVFLITSMTASLYAGYHFFKSPRSVILLMTLTYAIKYIFEFIMSYKFTVNEKKLAQ